MNNAGIQFVSPVVDFPEDKWDDIIAVCLNSAFHASKAALPYMQVGTREGKGKEGRGLWGRELHRGEHDELAYQEL